MKDSNIVANDSNNDTNHHTNIETNDTTSANERELDAAFLKAMKDPALREKIISILTGP